MPLNTFTLGIKLGELPEFCGPNDLADVIVAINSAPTCPQGFRPPISDDGIRRLVHLAYFASLATDEGRYPSFRMICSAGYGTNSIWSAGQFCVPLDGVESLRRLAPAVSDLDTALLISESEGEQRELICTGLALFHDLGFSSQPGRPEIVGVGTPPSFIVRVDGPGRIRASSDCFTFQLDGGKIRQIVEYRHVQAIRELWSQLASRLLERVIEAHGEDGRKWFTGEWGLAEVIHKVWSSVLYHATEKRHGGAFVVVPAADTIDLAQFSIKCKYNAELRLGEEILAFWNACVLFAKAATEEERNPALHQWRWRRERLFIIAKALAGLSSVDGCVVVDRNLAVLGFGGEIHVDEAKASSAPRSLRNIKTGELTPEGELLSFGTRHRSAYRLCKVQPGTIAFVISQDGDLRIFCSTDKDVNGFQFLHAWVHETGRM